jgi:zinc/manganese transport system permease protein
MGLSALIALGTVWSAIALSFLSNLPIGFFVGSIGAGTYAAGRGWVAWRRNREASPRHSGQALRSGAAG